MFIEEIKPKIKQFDSNIWRWETYLCEEVDLVYKSYLPIFKNAYSVYSGRLNTPGSTPFMSI